MKSTRLIPVLLGLAAMAMVTADAHAIYHPGMGRFLQRDPGPGAAGQARVGAAGPAVGGSFAARDPVGGQYADGMNLYQYVRSQPTRYVDPTGTRIFASAQGDIANKAQGALEKLCPCFYWDADQARNMIEIKIKTWEGKDAKGNKKVFPYDPTNEAAKKKFCRCYLPEKKTKEELEKTYRQ